MYEIEHFRAARGTRKELEALRRAEIVARTARDIEARAAAEAAGNRERLRLAAAQFRVAGVYSLASYATHRATSLNHQIRAESSGNPELHAIHRSFEETAAVVTGLIIYNYGAGQ